MHSINWQISVKPDIYIAKGNRPGFEDCDAKPLATFEDGSSNTSEVRLFLNHDTLTKALAAARMHEYNGLSYQLAL